MKTFKCPCNKGEVREVARPGRRTHFRNIPDLEIPADVSIPTCSACGEEWIDEEVAARLDDAMEDVYRAAVAAKVEGAIRDLKPVIAQRDLEELLDLSGGYISKVKSGKETSVSLVSALMMLAESPAQRVEELRNRWRMEPKVEARPSVTLRVCDWSGDVEKMRAAVAAGLWGEGFLFEQVPKRSGALSRSSSRRRAPDADGESFAVSDLARVPESLLVS